MKRLLRLLAGFSIVLFAVIIIKPTLAFSSPLTMKSSFMIEDKSFVGPDPPWVMDWDDPLSINIPSAIGGILKVLGVVDMEGDIFGAGISTWSNYVSVSNQGLTFESQTSAVGTLVTGFDVWNWPESNPQIVNHSFFWGATYELNDTQGTPYKIDLDIDYTHFNLAFGGTSYSGAGTETFSFTLPASEKSKYTNDPMSTLSSFSRDQSDFENFVNSPLGYNKRYEDISGFEETTGHIDKYLNLGTMESGDRLYLFGGLLATTMCENIAAGLTSATMFPKYSSTLLVSQAQQIPSVPEPATIVLFGIGLLGFAGISRKKR